MASGRLEVNHHAATTLPDNQVLPGQAFGPNHSDIQPDANSDELLNSGSASESLQESEAKCTGSSRRKLKCPRKLITRSAFLREPEQCQISSSESLQSSYLVRNILDNYEQLEIEPVGDSLQSDQGCSETNGRDIDAEFANSINTGEISMENETVVNSDDEVVIPKYELGRRFNLRKSYSREEKLRAIDWYFQNGQNKYRTCKHFSLNTRTLGKWIAAEEKIRQGDTTPHDEAEAAAAELKNLHQELYKFYKTEIDRREGDESCLTDTWLKEKSETLAQKLCPEQDFQFSTDWLTEWRQRYIEDAKGLDQQQAMSPEPPVELKIPSVPYSGFRKRGRPRKSDMQLFGCETDDPTVSHCSIPSAFASLDEDNELRREAEKLEKALFGHEKKLITEFMKEYPNIPSSHSGSRPSSLHSSFPNSNFPFDLSSLWTESLKFSGRNGFLGAPALTDHRIERLLPTSNSGKTPPLSNASLLASLNQFVPPDTSLTQPQMSTSLKTSDTPASDIDGASKTDVGYDDIPARYSIGRSRNHRKSYTREEKLRVLDWYYTHGENKYRTCKVFNLNTRMLGKWVKAEGKIRSSRHGAMKVGSGRRPFWRDMEDELYRMYLAKVEEVGHERAVPQAWFRTKSEELMQHLHPEAQFKFSYNWLEGFKTRYIKRAIDLLPDPLPAETEVGSTTLTTSASSSSSSASEAFTNLPHAATPQSPQSSHSNSCSPAPPDCSTSAPGTASTGGQANQTTGNNINLPTFPGGIFNFPGFGGFNSHFNTLSMLMLASQLGAVNYGANLNAPGQVSMTGMPSSSFPPPSLALLPGVGNLATPAGSDNHGNQFGSDQFSARASTSKSLPVNLPLPASLNGSDARTNDQTSEPEGSGTDDAHMEQFDVGQQKVHRKSYTREEKIQVLDWFHNNGRNKYKTSKMFTMNIRTLAKWIRAEDKIRRSRQGSMKSGSGRRPFWADMENELLREYRKEGQRRGGAKNIPQNWFEKRSEELMKQMHPDQQFIFSAQWLERFKKRHALP